MKYRLFFFAFVLMTGLLLACTDSLAPGANPSEIRFSVGIASSNSTRLTTSPDFVTQFESGDAIGIFIYKRPVNEDSNVETTELYINNIKAVYQNGNWVPESPIYYPNDGSLIDIYAYFPYAPGAEVQGLNYNALSQMTDFLAASTKAVEKQKNQTVALLFEHKLALIHLTVHKGQRPLGMDASFQAYFSGQTGGSYHAGTDSWSQPLEGELCMQLVGEADETTRVYRAWVPAQSLEEGHRMFTYTQISGSAFSLVEEIEAPIQLQAGQIHRHATTLGSFPHTQLLYNLYDPYPKYGSPVGIVVEIENSGKNGIVMSLINLEAPWSTVYETTNSGDLNDGITNTMKIQALLNWRTHYPAFAACTNQGEGWYLPPLNVAYFFLKTNFHILNDKLQQIPGADLIDGGKAYWTSTEATHYDAHRILGGNGHSDTKDKMEYGQIRAFFRF